ncbi:hypothetical protein HG530_006843 [Fusarium avenaceum]|nr:hypothetical protein HG530_006843 [Fusarium avenaceum]
MIQHQLLRLDVQPSRGGVADAEAQPDLVVEEAVAALLGLISVVDHAARPDVLAVGLAVVRELLADAHHVEGRDGRVDNDAVVVPRVRVLGRVVAHLHHSHYDGVVLHGLAGPAVAEREAEHGRRLVHALVVPRLGLVVGREGFVDGGFGLGLHVHDGLFGRVEAVQLAGLHHEHHFVVVGAEGGVDGGPVLLALVPGVLLFAFGRLATEELRFGEFNGREFFCVLAHLLNELGDSCAGVDDVHAFAEVIVVDLVSEDEHGGTVLPPEQLHVFGANIFVHVGLPLAVVLGALLLGEVLHEHLMPIVVRSELGPAE